jgi:hypothetical protein
MWSGKDEIVYQLAATADGLTALTGNRGRIFTIHADGSYSDVAHLEAQQAVALTAITRRLGWWGRRIPASCTWLMKRA